MNETEMRVQVELFGLPRIIAGEKTVTLSLQDDATFRDVVRALGKRFPELMGDVIKPEGEALQSPNILNLNGRRMIQPHQMEESVSDGDKLVLMSMSAGG
jgi:molybdopterin converting factor small subunit